MSGKLNWNDECQECDRELKVHLTLIKFWQIELNETILPCFGGKKREQNVAKMLNRKFRVLFFDGSFFHSLSESCKLSNQFAFCIWCEKKIFMNSLALLPAGLLCDISSSSSGKSSFCFYFP